MKLKPAPIHIQALAQDARRSFSNLELEYDKEIRVIKNSPDPLKALAAKPAIGYLQILSQIGPMMLEHLDKIIQNQTSKETADILESFLDRLKKVRDTINTVDYQMILTIHAENLISSLRRLVSALKPPVIKVEPS